MYIKYQQNIWLAREIKIKAGQSTSYKYKLGKCLIDITGKQNAIKWIKNYYIDKYSKPKSSKSYRLVIELFSYGNNQFFLIIPKSYNTNELKLRYVNITNYIIN